MLYAIQMTCHIQYIYIYISPLDNSVSALSVNGNILFPMQAHESVQEKQDERKGKEKHLITVIGSSGKFGPFFYSK